jgi:2-C-methyl-D-erythritol 4-phosphate cytidylyltransferase/2-C-methyl-D-erythritol 2,4-cyclodiphosphate synthase
MQKTEPCIALIVAAGQGLRAGGGLPKQFRPVAGKSILRRSVDAFLSHPAITQVQVVISPEHRELYDACVAGLNLPEPIPGGASRQESVFAGLAAIVGRKPATVLIHDAARALVDPGTITAVCAALEQHEAVLPAIPVADTLKHIGTTHVRGTLPREEMALAQTPQGFHFEKIMSAHQHARGKAYTDDASIAEAAGLAVHVVPGTRSNFKLTTPEDFVIAEQMLLGRMSPRIGTGFDVHRFTEGDHVWLCGVKVPHSRGLDGHSDADVGLHALTDAILGAAALGDIGQHFPPSDMKWKGAASHVFLAHAATLLRERGGVLENVDVTVICEQPKVSPHRDEMAKTIASILGIDRERVSVKATTTEGLGFTGRKEGIAAQAVAMVRLP